MTASHLKPYYLESDDPARDLTFYEVTKPYTVGIPDRIMNTWHYTVAGTGQFIVVDSFHNITIMNASEVKRVLNERNKR